MSGPQQLKPVPLSTGEPAIFGPALAAPSRSAGSTCGAHGSKTCLLSKQARPVDLSTVRRPNGDPLAAGDEIFQKITVSDNGSFLGKCGRRFSLKARRRRLSYGSPGSGSSVELYKRLGSVRQDPRSTTTPDGFVRCFVRLSFNMPTPNCRFCRETRPFRRRPLGSWQPSTAALFRLNNWFREWRHFLWDAGSSGGNSTSPAAAPTRLAEADWNGLKCPSSVNRSPASIDGIVYDAVVGESIGGGQTGSSLILPTVKLNLSRHSRFFDDYRLRRYFCRTSTNGAQTTALASFTYRRRNAHVMRALRRRIPFF